MRLAYKVTFFHNQLPRSQESCNFCFKIAAIKVIFVLKLWEMHGIHFGYFYNF